MISDICYEQIKDDFWYASYLGLKVVMMKSNGYINANKLCSDGGKALKHWLDNKHSKEMLEFYQDTLSANARIKALANQVNDSASDGIPSLANQVNISIKIAGGVSNDNLTI